MAKRKGKSKSSDSGNQGIPYYPPGQAPSDIAEANRLRTFNNLMSQVTGDPFYGYDPKSEAKKQAFIDKTLATGAKGRVVNQPIYQNFPATAKTAANRSVVGTRQVVIPVKDSFGTPIKSDYFNPMSDKLSGRTPDSGTRSLLEGLKGFLRGGGLLRGSK